MAFRLRSGRHRSSQRLSPPNILDTARSVQSSIPPEIGGDDLLERPGSRPLELTAHQVPSVWLPQIHPAFLEVRLFLSGKVMDEARDTEACIKRLWLNGASPTDTPPDTDILRRRPAQAPNRNRPRPRRGRTPDRRMDRRPDRGLGRVLRPAGTSPRGTRGPGVRTGSRRQPARPRVPHRSQRIPPLPP